MECPMTTDTVPILSWLIGQRAKRHEDPRLVRGRGAQVDDMKIHGRPEVHVPRAGVGESRTPCRYLTCT